MRRRPRTPAAGVALAGVLCTVLAVLPVAPAAAHDEAGRPELAPTMLVLDASGSMTGQDPAGGTKIEAARRAVHALVAAAPDGAPVGLAVYGTSTGNSAAERARGCQDVTVLRPPAALDKAAAGAAVDALVPRGYTPIGRALQVAAEQLPAEGPRSIVLVSDGEDTCAPPEPCEVVRTLAGQGVDLVVHTVGFGVDDAARAQLSCVAQATGGTYSDAPDAEALQRVLPRVTTTALRNYQPSGTPITGTAGWQDAPVAEPGQHLDTIGGHEQRFYAVDVPAGATAYFSATVSFPRSRGVDVLDDFNSLQLRVFGEGGQDCHEFESQQSSNSSDGAALTVATTWTGAAEQGSDDPCTGGGRYVFAVTWDRVSAGVPARLPVELLVGVEPAAGDPGPAAVPAPARFTEPAGEPQPVTGGGSFHVAGTLDGSGTYTDVVRRSEFVFYRVRLDWGQGLAYRVRFGETPGRGVDNLSPVSTRLYTPSRHEIAWEFASYTGSAQTLPASEPAIATVPVRYANRDADDADVRTQGVAGWYYIAVQVNAAHSDTGEAQPVPVRLEVAVTGEPEPGPRYVTPVDPQGGPFGAGRAAEPAPQQQASAAAATRINAAGWIAIAAGAAVVVALAVAALGARRRAGRPRH